MKKEIRWILLALVFAALLAGAYFLYNNLSAQVQMDVLATQPAQETVPAETKQEQMLAPHFTVYDLEGYAHKLSDFRGKPVILNFWASWCGPCKMEMPDFEEKYLQYQEDIHFLMVNLTDGSRETVESASQFIAEQGYTFPVYYDTDLEAAYAYGVNAVPVTYFFDAEGYFAAWGQGALSGDVLQKGIDMLLQPEE